MTDKAKSFLEILEERGIGALNKKMGIEILEATAERVVGTMPVETNTQVFGILHGGANVVLAETLGSLGAWMHTGGSKRVVGVDINATHHKAATSGLVTGVATPVSLGRTLACYEIVITNEAGQRTCSARITNLILGD
jgi:uncharacterized protein (TIGR00369 family)